MDYSLDGVYEYILDLTDKKGSDLFQLPLVLDTFQNSVHDFLRERVAIIENTQQVTEDVQRLIETKKQPVQDDPEDTYVVLAPVPNDTFHILSVVPIFAGNVKARRQRMVRWGSREALAADPHNRPSVEYPHIYQAEDFVTINSGYNEKALYAYMTYMKKPTFATVSQSSTRIVNLPDPVIDDIILKTVDTLFGIVGDPRTQNAYRKEQSFGNINQ